jgi:Family of unknown function (DUF6134)
MNRLLPFLLLFAATPALAEPLAWNFRVFLDEREIGHHHFTLRTDGGTRELRSEARFQVRVLGLTVYRYAHDAMERWRGECLQALDSTTDDNGDREKVDWRGEPGGCNLSFAYWNPKILQGGSLLNAQTGRFEPVTVSPQGEETIEVRGRPTVAQRYRLAGANLAIDLWYAGRQWVALESAAKGGRRLRYRLI